MLKEPVKHINSRIDEVDGQVTSCFNGINQCKQGAIIEECFIQSIVFDHHSGCCYYILPNLKEGTSSEEDYYCSIKVNDQVALQNYL